MRPGRCARSRRGSSPAATCGKKPSTTMRSTSSRLSVDRARAADQARAGAEQRHRRAGRRIGGQQPFLGRAAAFDQLRQLAGRQARRGAGSGASSLASARCASARSMLSPPSIRWRPTAMRSSRGSPPCRLDAHQAQVGGAAADVADQHQPRVRQRLGERVAVAEQPVVERSLRLFEQAQRRQAGVARGLERQRARRVVERGRHRQHQLLVFEQGLRKAVVPGRAQVREVARARGHRRDLRHVGRRAPGQDGRQPVDRGMRQPALRAGHQPPGHLGAELARQAADHRGVAAAGRRPGQRQIARRQFARRRVVAHRRQQRPRRHFAGRDQLLDLEQADGVVRRSGPCAAA